MKFIKYLILVVNLYYPDFIRSQDFYSSDLVNEIEIVFEEENWDQILDEYWSKGDKERLNCKVKINGMQFDSVGVRYKGYSSYKRNYLKKPLNIKLDYTIDQAYNGVKTLKLSNGYRDPTFIREVLAYEIARKYMPTSRANYAVITINGLQKGIYTSVETIDNTFLRKFYGDNDGVFFKGSPKRTHGALIGKADLQFLGYDSSAYFNSYELKSDNGWEDLIQLCDILVNNIDEIEAYLNIDQALWMMAFNNVIVNMDSPINVFRNFYLYKDSNGRFNILPWDLNMAFGTYKVIAGINNRVTINTLQTLDPLFNASNSSYPLVSKILQVREYRKKYIAHMKTLLSENFENDWYLIRAKELQEKIASNVMSDVNKFYSNEDF